MNVGELHSLPAGPRFDGAQMLGVRHHVAEADRAGLLRELTWRLKPGAPLVVGCRDRHPTVPGLLGRLGALPH